MAPPSRPCRWRKVPPRPLRIEGMLEDVHAVGYLWLDVCGRYLCQRLLAQGLHMAASHPTVLIIAEVRSRARPEDPQLLDYTRHIVLPVHGKMWAGLDVYVHSGTTTRPTVLWGKEDANALLMEVLTPWGKHLVLAAHAPPNQHWL